MQNEQSEAGLNTVSRENHVYLDRTVSSFFGGGLAGFKDKLWDAKIHRIGELIQLPEATVFELAPTSKGNQDRVRATLADVGLRMGMSAPDWRSPSRNTPLKVGKYEIA